MLLLAAQIVLACSCAQQPPLAESVKKAAAVFSGKVTALTPAASQESDVTFEVSRVWRGDIPEKVVIRGGGGMCGYPFDLDHRYLVFTYVSDGTLRTSLCSATREVTAKAPIPKALGAGKKPAPAP